MCTLETDKSNPDVIPMHFARIRMNRRRTHHGTTACHQNKQFPLKALAILLSRFSHVLLLDADNFPVKDPSFLFDLPAYTETGALFWPDFWYRLPRWPSLPSSPL